MALEPEHFKARDRRILLWQCIALVLLVLAACDTWASEWPQDAVWETRDWQCRRHTTSWVDVTSVKSSFAEAQAECQQIIETNPDPWAVALRACIAAHGGGWRKVFHTSLNSATWGQWWPTGTPSASGHTCANRGYSVIPIPTISNAEADANEPLGGWPDEPPPDPQAQQDFCDAFSGASDGGPAWTFTAAVTSPDASVCWRDSCVAQRHGVVPCIHTDAYGWQCNYKVTSQVCEGAPDPSQAPDQDPEPERCADAGGSPLCNAKEPGDSEWDPLPGQSCGYLDGVRICVDSIPDGACVQTPSGGVVCVNQPMSPPAPDTGTAGEKATPDGRMVDAQGREAEVYGKDTAAGSSSAQPGPVEGSSTGTKLPGASALGSPTCGGAGQPACDDGWGSFQGEGPGDLYDGTELTFSGVLGGFTDRLSQAPFYQAASGFFTVNVSGSCPAWQLPAVWIFPAIAIDMQCSPAMEAIWPLIAAIVIASCAFIGFRWAFL